MDKKKVCIVVPIKTNNVRLPGKTFRKLNGKPLYYYLFNTLKKLKDIDIYVDSSDEKVLEIAKEWGFNTFKRPERFNEDDIAGDDLLNRIIDGLDYKIIGLLHITSPFLSKETIERAIKIISENEHLDSLFGVELSYNRFWFKKKPLNHNIKKLVRTQDLEPLLVESPDLYFFRKKSFKKYKKRVCGRKGILRVNPLECADIDNLKDFLFAELLLKKKIVKI